MRDLYSNILAAASINVAARTASVNGSGIDLQGYEAATAVGFVGAWAGNQGTHTIALQESADNSTFTAVAAGNLVGSAIVVSGLINRAGGTGLEQGYIGNSRYLRAASTAVGAGSNCTYGVLIVRGLKRSLPVTK